MSARTLIFALIAMIMAGGTAFYARTLILKERQANIVQANSEDEIVLGNALMVLVAKEPLPAGSFVQEGSLEWVSWPEENVMDSYITVYRDDLENDEVDQELRLAHNGAVARQKLLAGQPVTEKYFVHPGDSGFLAAVLAPGNRAITVPISETTGIAGFAFPGDRVDLMLSLKLKGEDMEGSTATRYASLTLVEDIRVLAIGQSMINEDEEPVVAKTATVEVSQKQAEKIALGLAMGHLSLSLRGLQDQVASVNQVTEDALTSFLNTGSREEEDNRNFTLDVEVFTVNGVDTSLRQQRTRTKQATPEPNVTVLRGGGAATNQ
ncbi:Flp pilus assembly protein CpaB [Aestuariispira insulae]|uniref:Pilus assembly protein CpaB n=1 Tax=Aestuariispira insulae TaxID=1461337 RepID=A0A3D9HMX3_9PROT|nr:Flp pilus assembly protein CpaB [Aestuariispira insulae]RED50850.1 pilus assembly protein CpaB [Aestuariispira insulae]